VEFASKPLSLLLPLSNADLLTTNVLIRFLLATVPTLNAYLALLVPFPILLPVLLANTLTKTENALLTQYVFLMILALLNLDTIIASVTILTVFTLLNGNDALLLLLPSLPLERNYTKLAQPHVKLPQAPPSLALK